MSRFPLLSFSTLPFFYILQIVLGVPTFADLKNECKQFIIDVDTGVDDAMALTMVLGLGHSVEAITVAAGNTDLENAYNNTLRTLEVLNKTACGRV